MFVKGTGPDSTDSQRRRLALGASLAPHVTAVSPPLLWSVQADGWDITGWPALPGRPWADQEPGSGDIPKIIGLLTELSEIPAPDILTRTAREYWARYSDDPAHSTATLSFIAIPTRPISSSTATGHGWSISAGPSGVRPG